MQSDIIHKMAKNTRKRDAVKWVRDRAKAAYEKADKCAICGSVTDLELHHFHSLTNLFEGWAKSKGYSTETDEDVVAIRDEFIASHHREIYEMVVTLCNKHHVALHTVYGAKPVFTTAEKQAAWVEKQKVKFNERMAISQGVCN